jgi:epoxyqueuosine reductase QueG
LKQALGFSAASPNSVVTIRFLGFLQTQIKEALRWEGVHEMNLTTPKAILTGLSLIALAILFQPRIAQLSTPPAHPQSAPVPGHATLNADHEMMKTALKNIQFAIEHIPACK